MMREFHISPIPIKWFSMLPLSNIFHYTLYLQSPVDYKTKFSPMYDTA